MGVGTLYSKSSERLYQSDVRCMNLSKSSSHLSWLPHLCSKGEGWKSTAAASGFWICAANWHLFVPLAFNDYTLHQTEVWFTIQLLLRWRKGKNCRAKFLRNVIFNPEICLHRFHCQCLSAIPETVVCWPWKCLPRWSPYGDTSLRFSIGKLFNECLASHCQRQDHNLKALWVNAKLNSWRVNFQTCWVCDLDPFWVWSEEYKTCSYHIWMDFLPWSKKYIVVLQDIMYVYIIYIYMYSF